MRGDSRRIPVGALTCIATLTAFCAGAASIAPKTYSPVTLEVGEQGPAPAGVAPPSGYAWQVFANHTHTIYSHDGYVSVQARIQEAAASGADAVAITDHRNADACSDPFFLPIDGCYPICGEEWGGDMHAGLLNLAPGDPMDGWTVEAMIPEALARGATIVVNHPKSTRSDPWPYEELQLGIRGIEVWNVLYNVITGGQQATLWWNGFLTRGRALFAIAGSDNHYSGNSLNPCNYVLATGPEPDAIQDALEAGAVVMARDQYSGRCLLWCDADLDGQFEVPVGGNVVVTEPRTIRFRIEAYGLAGWPLVFASRNGQQGGITVGAGDPWRVDIDAEVGPDTKDFLRVEIPHPTDIINAMVAMTNPIYVNFTPDDADSDGVGDAAELAFGVDMYDPDSDGDGVSDGFEIGYDGRLDDYDPYDPDLNPTGTDLDALREDTDGDGVSDARELTFGSNPLNPAAVPRLPLAGPAAAVLCGIVLAALALRSLRVSTRG